MLNLVNFLTQLGYLVDGFADQESLPGAIAEAQKFYGLPETGEADETTLRVFGRTPRCGCRDVEAIGMGAVVNRWGIRTIRYFVKSYPAGLKLSRGEVDREVELGFAAWSDACDLTFEPARSEQDANIVIGTGRGRASDFDGPGGTLAWAYLPQGPSYHGRLEIRFDRDEAFTTDPLANGILFGHVLKHEIGHTMGLTHTPTAGQLMRATYSPAIGNPQQEDRQRVVSLYGAPSPKPSTPMTPAAGKKVEVKVRLDGGDVYAGELAKQEQFVEKYAIGIDF